MIKAVFFDFDGTLADTSPGIVLTMQKTFEQMGLAVPSAEQVRQTIGLPLVEAVRQLGGLTPDEAEHGTAVYRQLFPVYEVGHVSVFPQVSETLEQLSRRGIRMAICTSRTGITLDLMVERFGINHYFETKVSCNDNLPSKPAPDMVFALLSRMGLEAEDALVVGDTTFDIEMGNRAGCRTVAVTYGNHSRQKLLTVNPTFVVDSMAELLQNIH